MNGNWRVKVAGLPPSKQPRSYAPTSQRNSAAIARSQATNCNPKAPTVQFDTDKQALLKHEYKQGMIINAPVHEPMNTTNMSRARTLHQSISAYGGVFIKTRYLIVIAEHETDDKCIPLYSHNREGLKGKEHYKDELVSVRDHRLGGDSKAQSNLKPLVTEQMTGPLLDKVSTAWLTHTVVRSYDLYCQVCGQLTQQSVRNLVAYYKAEAQRGLEGF